MTYIAIVKVMDLRLNTASIKRTRSRRTASMPTWMKRFHLSMERVDETGDVKRTIIVAGKRRWQEFVSRMESDSFASLNRDQGMN